MKNRYLVDSDAFPCNTGNMKSAFSLLGLSSVEFQGGQSRAPTVAADSNPTIGHLVVVRL